jgi:hypothetical protein
MATLIVFNLLLYFDTQMLPILAETTVAFCSVGAMVWAKDLK